MLSYVFCVLSRNKVGVATTEEEKHKKKNIDENNIITLHRRKTKTGLKKLPIQKKQFINNTLKI